MQRMDFNTNNLGEISVTSSAVTIITNINNNNNIKIVEHEDYNDKSDIQNNNIEGDEYEALLLCSNINDPPELFATTAAPATLTTTATLNTSASDVPTKLVTKRYMRGKQRAASCACIRTLGQGLRSCACTWYINYLLSFGAVCAFLLLAYSTRDYARRLLFWIEAQNTYIIFMFFLLFFIMVSFPIVFGYFLLNITSGYLFGCLKGFLNVLFGANMGIAIAHLTISCLKHRIPIHKIIKNETGRAILRVISGPRAFRVVLFTRLTPIPFGIQNAIFGISSINSRIYFTATFLGLLPAQAINVYLGSTLRSMHEVLNNPGTALTGYFSIGLEVICGVALMFWVLQKARTELAETLLSDISCEGKLLDIEV